ncbi:MAG: isoprenyl transferase [Gammaproteobacteria bacterium]|nr:isoprenyl transferase [Gammaproteobacteria bacterium]
MSPVDKPTQDKINQLSHVAIIMDGNGRWAKSKFMPRFAGHKAGLNTVKKMVTSCIEEDIKFLTLFAFSSENWRRPKEEIKSLMGLFSLALKQEVKKLHKANVKLQIIGDLEKFSIEIQTLINEAVKKTEINTGLVLTIAANYGGRWDIVQAVHSMIQKVKQGELDEQMIDESCLESYLQTASLPEPDLFIRTGGEKRISNFLLWNLAYSEFYFTDVLWPDFDQNEFQNAINSYKLRQRRFGRTGEQIELLQREKK